MYGQSLHYLGLLDEDVSLIPKHKHVLHQWFGHFSSEYRKVLVKKMFLPLLGK